MMTKTRTFAVGFAALAAAGVIGGVTAVSLVGGQEPARQDVRTVSDEASSTPTATATPTSATAAPIPSPSEAAAGGKTRSTGKEKGTGKTVTDTDPADPATEPPAPPGNSAPEGVETPPALPPPPPPAGMECLPQEVGINPRCPATSAPN
ncbi:hypothetical protein [Micromonospora rubida]|uniref:hypothetical protein n=1 Tax=Micromonospora rubida TaxID=2697657 RepID=UPI001377850D|nr:hypothetical protein [Micromonospora rubida]NBE80301.1 hypothetical protein [Micromonospora rubida]